MAYSAKLTHAAPAHPCARGIPFVLNIKRPRQLTWRGQKLVSAWGKSPSPWPALGLRTRLLEQSQTKTGFRSVSSDRSGEFQGTALTRYAYQCAVSQSGPESASTSSGTSRSAAADICSITALRTSLSCASSTSNTSSSCTCMTSRAPG